MTSPLLLVSLLWVSGLSACAGSAPAPSSAGQAPAELAAARLHPSRRREESASGVAFDAIRKAYGEHVRREGTSYVVGGKDGLVFDASGDESDGKVVAIHWGGGTRP
ncbi:MAG: hypothetical protein IPG04_29090 [Polyangiaceae bacterium]|nr:hypothetical protein [Polyangiaceae bacterium]